MYSLTTLWASNIKDNFSKNKKKIHVVSTADVYWAYFISPDF